MSAPMPPVLAENASQAGVAHAITLCAALGNEHHAVLFKAVGTGRIAMTAMTDRLSRPNLHALNKSKRPGLVLVGDDDGAVTGPIGWAATAQIASWAHCAIIHATGADQRSYFLSVAVAEAGKRALLIETSSDAAEAWVAALRAADVRCMVLLPTGDGIHPVERAA